MLQNQHSLSYIVWNVHSNSVIFPGNIQENKGDFSRNTQYITLHMYTVSQKHVPTLASWSFNKHGLILIIFSKHHQHTFKNDMHIQLSLSLHFYLLYLLLNSCNRNNASWHQAMLVKWSSCSISRKYRIFSPGLCLPNSPVDPETRSTTEFGDWCTGLLISKYRVSPIVYRRYFSDIDGVIVDTFEKCSDKVSPILLRAWNFDTELPIHWFACQCGHWATFLSWWSSVCSFTSKPEQRTLWDDGVLHASKW